MCMADANAKKHFDVEHTKCILGKNVFTSLVEKSNSRLLVQAEGV